MSTKAFVIALAALGSTGIGLAVAQQKSAAPASQVVVYKSPT